MAERIAYLEAVVGADITQFRKSMRDIRGDVGILSDVIGGISGAARTMTYAFTAPMVALGTYAVQAASKFDASMRNINSIAQLPEAALQELSNKVLDFGKDTRSGADVAAKALYEVYSAGIMGSDAFAIMQIGVKTAEAGLADLTGTVKGLTAAGLTFGDTSEATMKRYSDATTLAVQLGVGSMDVFNTGISNVIGTGSLLGTTFEDLSATIAFMSQRGISFASAGTYMNNALSKMIKPSADLSAMFSKLHVKSGKELIETFGGISGALRAIYGQIGSSETEWAKLFPDVRGFKAVAPFIKAFKEDGNDAVNSFFTNFDNKMAAGNVTGAAWEQQMMSFSATVDHFKSALQGVAIVIGQAIIPFISPIINKITELLGTISDTNPEIIKMGVVFVGVIAAAAPIVWLLTSMISPIGVLVGAISALSVAFATDFGGIRTTVMNTVQGILGDLSPLTSAFKTFWEDLFPAMPTTEDLTGGQKVVVNANDVITIEKPMSLWDLYTSKGYDKYFSWTEFMKKAKEGGWDGKGLDIGTKITLPNPTAMNEAKIGLDKIATGIGGVSTQMQILADTDPPAPKLSFIENLTTAATNAWPKIQAALQGVWSNISNWIVNTAIPTLDSYGGKIMASISGWFAPTARQGKTESYNAFRDIFGGGAAKGVNEGIGKLQDTFPQISAGLKAMVDSIGAWLSTEGIPTVSRSIGYFVGKVGATFGELLGHIGDYITGGGAGKDGAKTAEGVKNSVISPALQGFNDAMKDANVTGGVNQFFSGLAGIIVAGAGVSVLGQMLVGKGFLSAIWSTLGSVMSGGVSIVSGVGGVAGKVVNGILNTSAGADVANKVSNFAGSILSSITDGLSAAANIITAPFVSVGTAIMGKISAALVTASVTASAAWTTVTTAIGTGLTAAAGTLTAATGWVMAVAAPIVAPIAAAIGALFAAMPALPIILAGIAVVGILSLVLPEDVKKKFGDLFSAVFGSSFGNQDLKPLDKPVELKVDNINTIISQSALDGTYINIFDQISGFLTEKTTQANPTKQDQAVVMQIDKILTQFKAGALDQSALEVQVNDLISNGLKVLDTSGDRAQYETPVNAVLKPTLPDAAKKLADDMLNPVWTAVGANIIAQSANGGTTDTTVLASSMTKPFIDEFSTHFGAAGDVTKNWQDFVTGFSTGVDTNSAKVGELTAKIIGFATTAVISNAIAIASFNSYNGIRTLLQGLQTDAEKLSNTLTSLVTHSPYKIAVEMTTTGQPPVLGGAQGSDDGSNATGYNDIPYDNYKANLHQGEAVLDKQTAAVWRGLPQMMANMHPAKDEVRNKSETNIYISGMSIDDLLEELNRRGIKLANR